MDPSLPTVVVTGFGPFRNFTVNPSAVVVEELKNMKHDGFNLVTEIIPVEYQAVQEIVPKLWKKFKPQVMIHCGASNQATTLVLETQACNEDYCSPDVNGVIPENSCCFSSSEGAECCLYPRFDMEAVCKEVNCSGLQVASAISRDAGRYLCEFIFYLSLSINRWSAFVHVPPLGQAYSSSQLASGLLCTIRALLKQRQNSDISDPVILLEQTA